MKTIEIELRYEVLDATKLANFLAPLQFLHTKHVIDIYLDTPDIILYRQGIFARVRNGKKLDIKFNRACLNDPTLRRQDYCEEHSFALPFEKKDLTRLNELLISLDMQPTTTADFESFKKINNIGTHYIIDKVRSSYQSKQFTIAVDEIAGLGTFLEIELMAKNTDNLDVVKNEMRLALAGLPIQPLRAGYCELFLKKNLSKDYLQGRFVQQEDIKHAVLPKN
jgi:predicted adenylyl cyclase CyaB